MTAVEGVGLRDEREFTPFAAPGWMSWDNWSPERDFCRFVGMVQRMLQPAVVLETGVGAGRLTAHLDLEACIYVGFESDPEWRHPPAELGTPTAGQMASADLVVLDSAPEFRIPEIRRWAEHGKSGSVCVVHDCGNGHPDRKKWSTHRDLRRTVEAIGLPGIFLRNPRGGWLGWHP